MHKVFLKILLIIFIILPLIVSVLFLVDNIKSIDKSNISTSTMSKNVIMHFKEDGYIEIEENIEINIDKLKGRTFPLIVYNENRNQEIELTNMRLSLDGKPIKQGIQEIQPYAYDFITPKDISYKVEATSIYIYNIMPKHSGNHVITIKYICRANDILEEYNRAQSILKVQNNEAGTYKDLKVTLKFPKEILSLRCDLLNARVKKIDNLNYQLDLTPRDIWTAKNHSEIHILNYIPNANIIDTAIELFRNEENLHVTLFTIIVIIEIVLFVFLCILTRKQKIERTYINDPQDILEPVLAEAIIDKKIETKNLIMSCITELICKGNLKLIGNDVIELVHYKNLSEYEWEFISLLFQKYYSRITMEQQNFIAENHPTIKLQELKNIFITDPPKTKILREEIQRIKRKIEDKLYENHIYNKVAKIILDIIKVISIVLIYDMLYLLMSIISGELCSVSNMMLHNIIVVIIGINHMQNRISIFNIKTTQNMFIAFYLFIIITTILIVFNRNFMYHIGLYLGILGAITLSLINLKKSNTHIFTKIGLTEYSKVLGLKQYIQDYSLMKEKDLENVIIWDEFLAYAVAFGISDQITNKFDEELMNLNVILQDIAEFLLN